MSAAHPWTAPGDIRASVRRRWNDGSLLRSHTAREPFEPISVPLRGPKPAEIGDDLTRVQEWIAGLEAGASVRGRRRYRIEYKQVGGRLVGRNQLPSRAIVSDWDEAWALLGVDAEVATFDEALRLTAQVPAARDWVLAKPLPAIAPAMDWPSLLAAYEWLRSHGRRGLYLREIDAPGVDTKFIESHRRVLAELLDVPSAISQFTKTLGFATKPAAVRLRFDAGFLGMPRHLSEGTFRLNELSAVRTAVHTAVIIENEITYLSVPVPTEGVVIFGAGFAVNHPGALPWLHDAEVHYWGDLDTHGFAILDRLRAHLPKTKSFLMDHQTLLAHRERWGTEPSPTSAALDRLTAEEHGVYRDLLTGRYAERLRLEQERIDWAWAENQFNWE